FHFVFSVEQRIFYMQAKRLGLPADAATSIRCFFCFTPSFFSSFQQCFSIPCTASMSFARFNGEDGTSMCEVFRLLSYIYWEINVFLVKWRGETKRRSELIENRKFGRIPGKPGRPASFG